MHINGVLDSLSRRCQQVILLDAATFKIPKDYEQTRPQGDVDAHNLELSWFASDKVRIKSADISSGDLQGKGVNGIMHCRIPKGCIATEGTLCWPLKTP